MKGIRGQPLPAGELEGIGASFTQKAKRVTYHHWIGLNLVIRGSECVDTKSESLALISNVPVNDN